MRVKTESGIVVINKRSHYGQFFLGYLTTPAWTGRSTLADVWEHAWRGKPACISWYAYGKICGRMTSAGIAIKLLFPEVI